MRRSAVRVLLVPSATLIAGAAVLFGPGAAFVVAGLLIALGVTAALGFRSVARRGERERRRATIEFCDTIAAELNAGLPVDRALRSACADWPGGIAVAAAAELGSEVAPALRAAAHQPGARGMAAVAAAWDVAGHSGAALAGVLERISLVLRGEEELRSEATASAGPARATARMLALLPLFGIVLGTSMGADPVGFLLGSALGQGCLMLGILLAAAGLWWVEKLIESVER